MNKMTFRFFGLTVASLAVSLFLFGCKVQEIVNSSGQTGDLTGRVKLSSANGYSPDFGGVTIAVEGTSFSATSDSAGYWTIKDLPSGTYSVSFSKPSFDTWKNTAYQFVGGSVSWIGPYGNGSAVLLSQPPDY